MTIFIKKVIHSFILKNKRKKKLCILITLIIIWLIQSNLLNLAVILNFIGVKMTMNCEYDSGVGVILPVKNKILPIVHLKLKIDKNTPTVKENTAAVFLLVVKMAAPHILV